MNSNQKFAIPLDDGLVVEAVHYGTETLCISCQAGCSVGCPFCASGSRGLYRNLTRTELIQQFETAISVGLNPRRVTVSGVGEPLHNPVEVRAFIDEMSKRGIPVSMTTTGYPLSRLKDFLSQRHNGLMISLHAGTPETRRRLVPNAPDLHLLWSLLEEVLPALSRRHRRRTGINYLLLEGVNDTPGELAPLRDRLRRFPDLTLHLLACNPVPDSPFRSPSHEKMEEIAGFFRSAGIVNVRRPNRWRIQPEGGCGTLFALRTREIDLGKKKENMLGF